MTTRQLRATCKRMARLIGLGDWTIECIFASQKELRGRLGKPSWVHYGDSQAYNVTAKTARIRIARQAEIDTTDRQTIETIGHELGHIRFDPFQKLWHNKRFEDALDDFGRFLADIEEGKA